MNVCRNTETLEIGDRSEGDVAIKTLGMMNEPEAEVEVELFHAETE